MTNGIKTDSNTAVLIYYSNVSGREPNNETYVAYDSSGRNNNGTVTGKLDLPTAFSYEGYAARLLTY